MVGTVTVIDSPTKYDVPLRSEAVFHPAKVRPVRVIVDDAADTRVPGGLFTAAGTVPEPPLMSYVRIGFHCA